MNTLTKSTRITGAPHHDAIDQEQRATVLVSLPAAPQTGSPVPTLTSIHADEGRGDYGDPKYRGNCSGLLIRDLLRYYAPKSVLDPMSGGGTCRDVCVELGIDCLSYDLRNGLDALDPASFRGRGPFDFVWLHPPYWRLIRYSNDSRCLSNAPTLGDFVKRLRVLFRNCLNALAAGGHIAVLMGDGKEGNEYWELPFRTLEAARAEGLVLAAPEIIRFSHGATSSRKRYAHAFIPRLHDVCLILRRHRQESSTVFHKSIDIYPTPDAPTGAENNRESADISAQLMSSPLLTKKTLTFA